MPLHIKPNLKTKQMKVIFTLIISGLLFFNSNSQELLETGPAKPPVPVSISLTNNATQLPGSGTLGVINTPVHPGFTIGTYKMWCEQPKHAFLQSFKLGYFYHHYSQHAISLYSEFVYSLVITKKFGFNTAIGAGYLHSIKDVEVFELSETGKYEKKKGIGMPQICAGLQMGFYYKIVRQDKNPISLALDYRFWVQAPFVREYVPVLPYSTLQLGVLFFINKK